GAQALAGPPGTAALPARIPATPGMTPSKEKQDMPQDAQRVAIITGAARGIGAATARRLATGGRPVAVLDLAASACEPTVDAITSAGGRAFAVGADVSQADQVEAAVGKVGAGLGPPTVL